MRTHCSAKCSLQNGGGCFPFVVPTHGPHLWAGHPEMIPLHLHKGCWPSEGGREIVEVDPADKWVSINFVMAATIKTVHISIHHHHPMWVYEVDGD